MRLFTDSASGTLLADIAVDATTFFLGAGEGVLFPAPSNYPDEWALLTIENDLGQKELVRLTARAGDELTVIRGQEGSQALAYVAGSRVELRVTASALNSYLQKGEGDLLDLQAGGHTRVYFRRYLVTGEGPSAGDLNEGELAVNIVDKKFWVGGVGASDTVPAAPVVLGDGVVKSDITPLAATTYVDTQLNKKLDKEGGTVTGQLVVAPDAGEAPVNVAPLAVNAPSGIASNEMAKFSVAGTVVFYVSKTGITVCSPLGATTCCIFSHQTTNAASHAYSIDLDTGLVPWSVSTDEQKTSGAFYLKPAVVGKEQSDWGVMIATDDTNKRSFFKINASQTAGNFSYIDYTWSNKDAYVAGNHGFRDQFQYASGLMERTWRHNGKLTYLGTESAHAFGDINGYTALSIPTDGDKLVWTANKSGNVSLVEFLTPSPAIVRQRFAADGTIQNYNNVYGQISARRYKDAITDATPKLADLMKLRVRNFVMRDDPAQVKMLGLVAEEVAEVFPGMVKEFETTDAADPTVVKKDTMVAYSLLAPMLLKALQEQQAVLEALQAKVEALSNG